MEGDKMADKVLNWLKTAIKKHFRPERLESETVQKQTQKMQYNDNHLNQLIATFVGRDVELKKLENFISTPK